MHSVLHLHLGHHKFDVLLARGQVSDDALVSVRDLGDRGLHRRDLGLGRILAVGNILVKRVDDLLKLLDATDHVLVVASHKRVNRFGKALLQISLVTDAGREGIEVFFTRELVDQASCETSDFLTCIVSLVWERWPNLITRQGRLFLWEEAKGESLAGLLVLTTVVHLLDLTISCPSFDSK